MVRLLGEDSYHVQLNPGRFIIVTEVVRIGSESGGSDGAGGGGGGGGNASSGGVGSGGDGSGTGGSNGDSAPGSNNSNNASHNTSSSHLHSSADTTEDTYAERVLHLQCGNMFDVKNIATADIVMMETDIPADQHNKLQVRILPTCALYLHALQRFV